MGQISRENRATRFIEAFKDRVAETCALKPGDTLTVKSVELGMCGGGGEVAVFVTVFTPTHQPMVLTFEDHLFDPEYTDVDFEYRDQLAGEFGLEPEEVERRLKEADLS